MPERLQKFIARSSRYSRRKAEELIQQGRVKVNNEPVHKLGTTVDPDKDNVEVDGKKIEPPHEFRYIVLHKPRGYVCTRAQHKGEKTVYDLVPESRALLLAGRLDKESEGLVLLTDDGAFVQQLTHPSYQHEKEYLVQAAKPVNQVQVRRLQRGVRLREGLAKADRIEQRDPQHLRVVLHQGWKRQIRRMCEVVGVSVTRLQRIRLGKYTLEGLPGGEWREIAQHDIV